MWGYVKTKFLAHTMQHRISERQDLLQSLLARPPFILLAVIGFLTLFGKILFYFLNVLLSGLIFWIYRNLINKVNVIVGV